MAGPEAGIDEAMSCSGRWAALATALLLSLGGCGGAPAAGAAGTVTFEGEAIDRGDIRFLSLSGTEGPGAAAPVRDGQYAIPDGGGLVAGRYRVAISATRETGRQIERAEVVGGEAGTIAEVIQYLPDRYNARSTLEVELTAGDNVQDFHMHAAAAVE